MEDKIKKTKKQELYSIFRKILDDKAIISTYIRGEITLEELHAKGIKFGKAL